MHIFRRSTLVPSAGVLLICLHPLMAQTGKIVVHTNPREAFVYADGQPIAEARGHFVCIAPGEHKIDVYNYGYKPESRTVTVTAHKTTVITVTMQPIPGAISGPWGCITLEGAPRAGVLLNGKDPAGFLVGHGDEFDNEWVWKQELIVPPGKHELTLECNCQKPWSTTVEVQPNQRVVVDAYKGVRKTVAWPRGQQLKELPRFRAGIASATIAVEKVTGQFAASPEKVNCGESARLTWSSTGAAKTELNDAAVSASGDQTVEPKQTTNYKFTAAGPGGVYTSNAAVNVDPAISASLSVSPADVHYQNGGDAASAHGTATVTWSAPNADAVTVDPLGSVGPSGSREIQVTPTKTTPGPVDETVTYTLRASNACGGSETRTATLHITGSIGVLEGAASETTLKTKLTLNSIYFPTDWPTTSDPQGGLVPSQEKQVEENASDFKQYLGFQPGATLILEGYADARGPAAYNEALSQRRADRVKSYFVEHGIPAEKIETKAFGKTSNLTKKEVEDLIAQNPNATPEKRQQIQRHLLVFQWANNRRVDIRLSTTGEISRRLYPFDSPDLNVLLEAKKPVAK